MDRETFRFFGNDVIARARENNEEAKYRRLVKKWYKGDFPVKPDRLVSPWDRDGRTIQFPDDEKYWETRAVRYNGTCEPEDTAHDIENWYWKEYSTGVNSIFDCTGKWFTSDVHVVKMSETTFTMVEYFGLDV